jgi:hypothetical protein
MSDHKETWFIDIDGTLLPTSGDMETDIACRNPVALPGAVDFLKQLREAGHMVVFVTGRPITMDVRVRTIQQLIDTGLVDTDLGVHLITGITRGVRYLVNDTKTDGTYGTAHAITVERNKGLEKLLEPYKPTKEQPLMAQIKYAVFRAHHTGKPKTIYMNPEDVAELVHKEFPQGRPPGMTVCGLNLIEDATIERGDWRIE